MEKYLDRIEMCATIWRSSQNYRAIIGYLANIEVTLDLTVLGAFRTRFALRLGTFDQLAFCLKPIFNRIPFQAPSLQIERIRRQLNFLASRDARAAWSFL
jgi:hypothetical protein